MYLKTLFKFRSDMSPGNGTRAYGHISKWTLIAKLLIVVFCAATLQANANNNLPSFPPFTVKGKVINKNTGEPVAGASVTVKGKRGGTYTDESGKFSLAVSSGPAVLVISSVGYATIEQPVNENTADLTIELVDESKGLGEVVVTALGIQRTAKSLTYATQKIGGEDINEVRDANFTNTLSGKIAGLTITPSANGPGGATRIILRGSRSIQSTNNALMVIDGVAIDNSTPAGQVMNDAGDNNGGQSGSDGASNINPDDIESINVLKGATGAALYGSRAANGVIIITTKRGKPGSMTVNVNSGITVDNVMLLPKLQNQYSQGAGGAYSTNTNGNWGDKVAGQSVTDWTGKTVNLQAYPDNIKDFFRTGLSTNNAVSASGGSEKVQTYLSYANNYANGIVPGNHLMRHTFNARFGVNITQRLSVDAKITYTLQDIYNKPGVGGDGLVGANIYRVPRTVNLEDLKTYKTTDVTGIETPTYWTTPDPVYMNPYWTVNNTHHDEDRSRVTALLALKYKLTDWLNLQGRVSSDSYNDFITQKYANNTKNYARNPGGYYSEGNDFIAERNVDVLLNGTNNLTHDLKVTYNLGASVLSRKLRHRGAIADGLNFPNKFDLNYATPIPYKRIAADVNRALHSVYGTVQFSYKDFLYLDLTARNDWSSTIASPYSYFYPSVSASAILSDMFKMPAAISFSKVRAAVTQVGNDGIPYLLNQSYSYIPGGFGGYIASSSVKSIPGLKPELTKSIELGTEWRFVKNRFGIDFTYYKTNSKNQLIVVSTPASSGYASKYINAGNIQNSGIEIVLSAKVIDNKDFTWDLGLNYALNKSKVISILPGVELLPIAGTNVRTAIPMIHTGSPYGELYGNKWQRLNGQLLVDSVQGLPVKNADVAALGSATPKYTAGFTNSFTYKNWSLGILVDGRFGGIVVSGTAGQLAFAGASDITSKYREAGSFVLDAVTPDGAKNTKAINAESFWKTVSGGDYSWGEVFTFDATNVRVREITLGYDFKHLPSFLKMAKLSFVARNLFFIYRGSSIFDIPGIGKRKMDFDPETSFGNSNYQGIEYYNLPPTRNLGLNLKLSF